jgi:hypothetical protein
MTDTLTASTYVDAPAVPPRAPVGLLDVATVVDRPDGTWEFGEQWDSASCGELGSYDADCLDLPAGESKDVVGANPQEAHPLIVHAAVKCGLLVAGTRYEDHARALLTAHQGEAVEHRLSMRWVETPGDDAQIITTPHTIVEAFTVLEEQAAEYGGSPIIHLSPAWATRAAAAGLLTWDTGVLTTYLGTRVAVGHGYTKAAKSALVLNPGPNVTPTADQGWLFVTGHVTLERSPVLERTVIDHVKNDKYALAERVYLPLVDCFVGGVLATKAVAP